MHGAAVATGRVELPASVASVVATRHGRLGAMPAPQLVLSYPPRRGAMGHGAHYRWGLFFSVQRLRGFRQVVTQAFTCRKLN